jgi:glucose-6-phosphate 1-epimerase
LINFHVALEPTDKIKAVYEKPFHLAYVVTLSEHQLSTDLHVKNTSSADNLEYQALFHNYLRAPSDKVLVSGLKDHKYLDKIDIAEDGKPREKKETRDAVDVQKFTDSIYEDAPQHYKVAWLGGGLTLRTTKLKDVVIWNPQETGSKMSDMEDKGW